MWQFPPLQSKRQGGFDSGSGGKIAPVGGAMEKDKAGEILVTCWRLGGLGHFESQASLGRHDCHISTSRRFYSSSRA